MLLKIISLLFLALTIVSCSSQHNIVPPIEFSEEYINKQIRLVPISQLSSFDTTSPVSIHLEYNTENKIIFPSNFNLRLFIKSNKKWIEIKEEPTTRYPGDNVIMSPDNQASYGQIVTFVPELEDQTKNYNMRVYVFGTMQTLDGDKDVAAFVDIILTPTW